MIRALSPHHPSSHHAAPAPALRRLSALAPLGNPAIASLTAAMAGAVPVRARRELMTEAESAGEPRLIVTGWAARVRLLADGRRQFLSFVLPGELIGSCDQPLPLAVSTIVALSDVTLCPAPSATLDRTLADVYAISKAMETAYLLAHITRLGRFSAKERIVDLLLELHERLSLAGLVERGGFDMPLTQEMLGDALGLTSVHINRVLQLTRREGDLSWRGGRVTLLDPPVLARKVGRTPIRVTAGPPPHNPSFATSRPQMILR